MQLSDRMTTSTGTQPRASLLALGERISIQKPSGSLMKAILRAGPALAMHVSLEVLGKQCQLTP